MWQTQNFFNLYLTNIVLKQLPNIIMISLHSNTCFFIVLRSEFLLREQKHLIQNKNRMIRGQLKYFYDSYEKRFGHLFNNNHCSHYKIEKYSK